jgi:LysM repeat protein
MGHWGWRPLIFAVFISVWVVGCSIRQEAAPTTTPTEYPPITLTVRRSASLTPDSAATPHLMTTPQPTATPEVSRSSIYIVQPGDTLLNIASHFGVDLATLQVINSSLDPHALQVGQQVIIPHRATPGVELALLPTATPLPLHLPSPTCYPLRTGSLLCLGRVDNRLDQPVEQVRVWVQLLDRDGNILAAQVASVDQQLIPIGMSAPYRVQFNTDPGAYAGVVATLVSAQAAGQTLDRFATLVIATDSSAIADEQYVVTATLVNPSPHPADSIRVVVTLFDDMQRVIGYRVVQLEGSLAGGEQRSVQIAVTPQLAATTITYSLYAEARIASRGGE